MAIGTPESAVFGPRGVQMIPSSSSAIAAYGYDPLKWKLYILPRSRATRVYIYEGFPPNEMENFLAAPSMGVFWNKNIKPIYQYY